MIWLLAIAIALLATLPWVLGILVTTGGWTASTLLVGGLILLGAAVTFGVALYGLAGRWLKGRLSQSR